MPRPTYKEQWNERYMKAYDAAIDNGKSHDEADYLATSFANFLFEDLLDEADNLRKARKENG